jgi:hypothetical protein
MGEDLAHDDDEVEVEDGASDEGTSLVDEFFQCEDFPIKTQKFI